MQDFTRIGQCFIGNPESCRSLLFQLKIRRIGLLTSNSATYKISSSSIPVPEKRNLLNRLSACGFDPTCFMYKSIIFRRQH
jgi:hypothetical protein